MDVIDIELYIQKPDLIKCEICGVLRNKNIAEFCPASHFKKLVKDKKKEL